MVDAWKIEYDKRQYQSMDDQLRQFQSGTLNLASLIAGLKILIRVLEAPDNSWVDEFLSEWGTLETIHAMALDRKEQGIAQEPKITFDDPANQTRINDAVQNMRRLLQERIGEDVLDK